MATLLTGDAGLRLGEALGLRWEDLDLVAGRITIARQIRKGVEGTPKGGRRRSVPLTGALAAALKALPQVRVGRLICGPEGSPVAEAVLKHGIYKRLPPCWAFRSGAGIHCATRSRRTRRASGSNPWRLQAWLGHSTINMTMRYVHHVEEHHRPIPEEILSAGAAILDPDQRVIAMLGARSAALRGNTVATAPRSLSSI